MFGLRVQQCVLKPTLVDPRSPRRLHVHRRQSQFALQVQHTYCRLAMITCTTHRWHFWSSGYTMCTQSGYMEIGGWSSCDHGKVDSFRIRVVTGTPTKSPTLAPTKAPTPTPKPGCKSCPVGYSTQANAGSADCTACAPGKWSANSSSPTCASCAAGQYGISAGQPAPPP